MGPLAEGVSIAFQTGGTVHSDGSGAPERRTDQRNPFPMLPDFPGSRPARIGVPSIWMTALSRTDRY